MLVVMVLFNGDFLIYIFVLVGELCIFIWILFICFFKVVCCFLMLVKWLYDRVFNFLFKFFSLLVMVNIFVFFICLYYVFIMVGRNLLCKFYIKIFERCVFFLYIIIEVENYRIVIRNFFCYNMVEVLRKSI